MNSQTSEQTQSQLDNKDTRAKKYIRASLTKSSTSYNNTNQTSLSSAQHKGKNIEKKSGDSTPTFIVTQNAPSKLKKQQKLLGIV